MPQMPDRFRCLNCTARGPNDDILVITFNFPTTVDEVWVESVGSEFCSVVEDFAWRKVVLDLTQVDDCQSSILGKYMTLHRKLKNVSGSLVLCSITTAMRTKLTDAKLLTYFTIRDTLDEAIAQLSAT